MTTYHRVRSGVGNLGNHSKGKRHRCEQSVGAWPERPLTKRAVHFAKEKASPSHGFGGHAIWCCDVVALDDNDGEHDNVVGGND